MTERMRDGVIKRGATFSYVVREKDPATGKTRPRWIGGFQTRKAAKDARDAARNAVNRGTYVAPQDLTVGAYLDRWLDGHSVELKPSTVASYRQKIDTYLRPAIGHERVQALSPSRLLWSFVRCRSMAGRMASRSHPGRSSLLALCCGGR